MFPADPSVRAIVDKVDALRVRMCFVATCFVAIRMLETPFLSTLVLCRLPELM